MLLIFRAHLNLAIAYYTLEDFGECIAALRRALEISPDDQKALLILAASYRRLQSYPEAVTTLRRFQSFTRKMRNRILL